TEFSRRFRIEGSRRGTFDIPLPLLGEENRRRNSQAGYVIAHASIYGSEDLAPDQVVTMPGLRALAPLVANVDVVTQRIHRVTDDGRAIAVNMAEDHVRLAPINSLRAIEEMIRAPGWTHRQTDNGRFSTRLMEKLGGGFNYLANQPALRMVLSKT